VSAVCVLLHPVVLLLLLPRLRELSPGLSMELAELLLAEHGGNLHEVSGQQQALLSVVGCGCFVP
jgi:hypothetical protein